MAKANGALSVLTAEATFLDRFNTNQEQSRAKGGAYDGINQEIEWYADLVDALVYTAVDTLTSAALEKFLRDFTDVLDTSKNLADLAADNVRDKFSKKWYEDKVAFNDMKELNPFNEFNETYYFNPEDFQDNEPDSDNNNDNNSDNNTPDSDSDSDSDSDNNTNAPDSGNNNDEDNAPEPIKPPPPRDPLVLDTNKDGFISTVALQDSNAYFDITGDGIKERVSWIAANDGILVYDKNESGKIDGIDEVFGNFTKNGFEELKELIDSNHDGVIDRQDELFNRLQIWNDLNGDGTTQTDELQSLKDAGVKSIDLNYVSTDITLGGIVNISFLPMNNIDFRTRKEVV